MKKLELKQMENLEGGVSRSGNAASCAIAVGGTIIGIAFAPVTFGLSTALTILAGSVSIVDGCIGWS